MRVVAGSLILFAVCAAASGAPAARRRPARPAKPAAPKPAPPRVVEVSIFKDGHALVRQEVTRTPNAQGEVALDDPPAPVLGSYLPYVTGAGAKLTGVVAGGGPATQDRTTLTPLLTANGARVRVVVVSGERYEGTLENAPPTGPIGYYESPSPIARLLGQSDTLLLRSRAGLRLVPAMQIRSLEILGPTDLTAPAASPHARFRVQLERPAPPRVTVGATYLQKGLRWIAGYQLNLDGRGTAHTHLRATILNELIDLNQTQTRLVVGIPHIYATAALDPISLTLQPPPLSPRFQPDTPGYSNAFGGIAAGGGFGGGGFGGGGMGGFSRGGMGGGGRSVRCGDPPDEAGAVTLVPPEVEEGPGPEAALAQDAAREDLYYLPPFPLTLKKGETKVMPLRELSLGYMDVYTVDIPFQPQEDSTRARGLTEEQREELLAQLYQVRAKHQLRITNRTDQPLTSGPAMVFRENRLVAQSLLLYTPTGSSSLCLLGEAPEIEVTHTDREVGREEVKPRFGLDTIHERVNLEGIVTLKNRTGGSVDVELTRNVPGNADSAPDGEVTKLDIAANLPDSTRTYRPWVNARTGAARVFWKIRLGPSETRVFRYTWHVFR